METRIISALIVIVILCCCIAIPAGAQERSLVRKGNELYSQQKYAEAVKAYQEALQKQPTFTPGAFNLGNALVQQKQYDAARKVMGNAVKTSRDPAVQSGAHYNTGNTFMSEQQWQQAVDAYKNALRKNPQDADAKYNLSYALAKLKQQQQQGGKDNQQKSNQSKDNKDKQQKDQQQKDDKKNGKQQQQQTEGDNDKHDQQRPQPQQSKISEQQADNMLKALQQDERKLQDKMQQGKAAPVRLEKDW